MEANFTDLQGLLKDSKVYADAGYLDTVNRATFPTRTRSQAVVRAGSTADIRQLLAYCREKGYALYVISTGKNWGFGSRVPNADVEILLDLSDLNRIISYDPKFGTIRCEPGVTFRQVCHFLREQGDRHFLNAIGGHPDSSLIGNALERGDGAGPYAERAAYVCSAEVILADGQTVSLGMGNVRYSKLEDLCGTGPGPDFQPLFFQSNLGVVTKMTFWLCRKPDFFISFQFDLEASHPLGNVLDILKDLYDRRLMDAPVTFWNDYKQLTNSIQYPWSVQPDPPLERSAIRAISNRYRSWYAFGGIYKDHPQMAGLTASALFRSLKGHIARKGFWSVLSSDKMKRLARLRPLLRNTKYSLEALFQKWENNPLLGWVEDRHIRSVYWRKKTPLPAEINPDQQSCGLLWHAFAVPFDGDTVAEVIRELERIIFGRGFEPVIAILLWNNRYVRIFQQLIFDREAAGEDEKALLCHREIFDYLHQSGYSHQRLDILNMGDADKLLKSGDLHERIKKALDPDSILAPGRYFMP